MELVRRTPSTSSASWRSALPRHRPEVQTPTQPLELAPYRPPVPTLLPEILALTVDAVDTLRIMSDEDYEGWYEPEDGPEPWLDLFSFSLISKWFLHLARSRLYRTVYLRLADEVGEWTAPEHLEHQAQEVVSTPHLASYVKHVVLKYFDDSVQSDAERCHRVGHPSWSPSLELSDVLAVCPLVKTLTLQSSKWENPTKRPIPYYILDAEAMSLGQVLGAFVVTTLREIDVTNLRVESDAGRQALMCGKWVTKLQMKVQVKNITFTLASFESEGRGEAGWRRRLGTGK